MLCIASEIPSLRIYSTLLMGQVECLLVVHETMEMLATLQPLVGVRFWRSLAIAAAFRMRQQYHAIETRRHKK